MAVPSAPEVLTTLAIKLLLPDKVTLLKENEVLPVAAVAVVHVLPLSADTCTL